MSTQLRKVLSRILGEERFRRGTFKISEPNDLATLRSRFITETAKVSTLDGFARNAIIAALQHNPTYSSSNIDGAKSFGKPLPLSWFSNTIYMPPSVDDADHLLAITTIADDLSTEFGANC